MIRFRTIIAEGQAASAAAQRANIGEMFETNAHGAVRPVSQRMADAMVELRGTRGHVLEQDLIDRDFSPDEIAEHGEAARALAARYWQGLAA